jgi:hypothetical protein
MKTDCNRCSADGWCTAMACPSNWHNAIEFTVTPNVTYQAMGSCQDKLRVDWSADELQANWRKCIYRRADADCSTRTRDIPAVCD